METVLHMEPTSRSCNRAARRSINYRHRQNPMVNRMVRDDMQIQQPVHFLKARELKMEDRIRNGEPFRSNA